MISVKPETKEELNMIRREIGNPRWDIFMCIYLDILKASEIETYDDLVFKKHEIIDHLNGGD